MNALKLFALLLLAVLFPLTVNCADSPSQKGGFNPQRGSSFGCSNAKTTIETLICSDDSVAYLDTQLNEAYASLLLDAGNQGAKMLRADQRRWLRNVRDHCADVDCLALAYQDRLKVIDPLADNKVTCAKMRRYPHRVFDHGLDLGSGTGSPNEVDYKCPESLDQQEFMKQLLALAEDIRGEDFGPCSGTLFHALWRYYHFTLAEAGIAPRLLINVTAAEKKTTDQSPPKPRVQSIASMDSQTLRYFTQWSEQSQYNLGRFRQFTTEIDRVFPVLARWYEHRFWLSPASATDAARTVLMMIMDRAAGSYPHADFSEDADLVRLVRNNKTTAEEVRRELTGHAFEPGQYPYLERYQALKVALLYRRPLSIVSLLGDGLHLEDPQDATDGGEPLLSFAIGSPQNLEYLLNRKVRVDAPNDFGKTALFYAIGAGNHEAARMLLKYGADVNHAYKSAQELSSIGFGCGFPNIKHTGRMPLMHAAQNSDTAMLKLLVAAGAKVDAVDDLGFNALDYSYMGKNAANAAYLKGLGMSSGAPRYSPDSDPDVSEHVIGEKLSIDGYVSKLQVAPGRPGLLVASVTPYDTLVAGPSHGLQLVDISNPDHPRKLAIVPGLYSNDFALSPDGKRAYVMEISNHKSPPDKKYGITIIDIANAAKPVLTGQIEGDFMKMHLSQDGKSLYLQERTLKPAFSRGLLVYGVESDEVKLKCSNSFGERSGGGAVFAYSFATFPDEPTLLIRDRSGELLVFDVKDSCKPIKLATMDADQLNTSMVGLAGKTLIIGGNDLQKFHVTNSLVTKTSYQASLTAFYATHTTDLMVAAVGHDVLVLGTNLRGQFFLRDRIRLADIDARSVLIDKTDHVYIGWNGGLGVSNIKRP